MREGGGRVMGVEPGVDGGGHRGLGGEAKVQRRHWLTERVGPLRANDNFLNSSNKSSSTFPLTIGQLCLAHKNTSGIAQK